MQKILRIGLPVIFAIVGSQTASASLILETFEPISGTGLGAVSTIVTFQNVGTETGCIGLGGATGSALGSGGVCSPGGDTKNGASQASLQPLSAAGISTGAAGAAGFGLVFNAVQPAGGSLAVTNITAAFYSPSGAFLYETSGLGCQATSGGPIVANGSGGCLLTSTAQGTGNSGFLVVLDAAQQAAAVAAGAFSSTSNLVGVSSSAGTTGAPSAGGGETIFLANSGATAKDSTVPEPASLSLIGVGLIGFSMIRRRATR
jgi:hypothetical protein